MQHQHQHQKITVNLGPRSYPIYIGQGTAPDFPSYYKDQFGDRKCAVITDSAVESHYRSYIYDTLTEELDCVGVYVFPSGETQKTIDTWKRILDFLVIYHLDRRSVLIALGGGVVGDIAGFAAACFMRGIDYVQIPTTLLAMVDSSVGGKTAVDHPLGKNLVGAFHQPSAVWIDADFLKTLPRREFVAGCAEAFKYAFIGGREMFSFIMDNRDAILRAEPAPLLECVGRSVRIKADIVGRDEREGESGLRALLNFGHTFAHALEKFYGFEGLLHGEAVLLGMVCAVELAKECGALGREYWADFDNILDGLPLPALPGAPDIEKIYAAMFFDKKAEEGVLRFILPVAPGDSEVFGGEAEAAVKEVLKKNLHC